MSSTNRGGQRHASDYYITPQSEIEQFLRAFVDLYEINDPHKMTWFDPCAGGGVQRLETKRSGWIVSKNVPMSYPSVIERMFGTSVHTMDIREDSAAQTIGSYIELKDRFKKSTGEQIEWRQERTAPTRKPDIIITNPPFSHATQIIEQALGDVDNQGFVIMLLRLNFLGSQERKPFFKKHMPEAVFVHPDRMSFTPDNKTDSVEYAHFVWRKDLSPETATFVHLARYEPAQQHITRLPGI